MNKTASICLILLSTTAAAQTRSVSEKLLTDQKGFFTCTGGGTSAPLFNRDCVKLNLSRISSPGSIKYEGTCFDANETTFFIACDSFTFEYGQMLVNKPKDPGSE
jgi:hypothetical protein